MGEYKFLHEYPPSPRTIQRIREAVERVRNKVEEEHGHHDFYWSGYTDALSHLLEEMEEYQRSLESPRINDVARKFGRG